MNRRLKASGESWSRRQRKKALADHCCWVDGEAFGRTLRSNRSDRLANGGGGCVHRQRVHAARSASGARVDCHWHWSGWCVQGQGCDVANAEGGGDSSTAGQLLPVDAQKWASDCDQCAERSLNCRGDSRWAFRAVAAE